MYWRGSVTGPRGNRRRLHRSTAGLTALDQSWIFSSSSNASALVREHKVNPVVGGIEGLRRKAAAAPVFKYAVAAGVFTTCESVQRPIGDSGARKEVGVEGVLTVWSKIRNNISCVRSDRNRRCKVDLLPP